MKRDGFAAPLILLAVFALIVIGGIAWVHYYYTPRATIQNSAAQNAEVAVPTPASSSSTSTTPPSTTPYTFTGHATGTATSVIGKVTIGADFQTTVSCGSADCFNKHFSACTPATMVSDIGLAAFSYKIIGPSAGGCKMTVMYTQNPNPSWINQPMTCTFDNKIDLQTSVQTVFNATIQGKGDCLGPLVNILKGS